MEYRETMEAMQKPDVFDGPNHDQHRPQWVGETEGGRDGSEAIEGNIELAPHTFPPGTKVSICEPVCPDCDEVPTLSGQSGEWKCGCDFDWKQWAEEQFS
jgi:hypothetical protein